MTDNPGLVLETESAAKRWAKFHMELHRALPDFDKQELTAFESDLAEHTAALMETQTGDELTRINNALEQLGPIETLASEFASTIPPRQRRRSEVISAVMLAICGRIFYAVTTTSALIAAIMGIAHLFNSDVGLWVHYDNSWSLSFNAQHDAQQMFRSSFSLLAFGLSAILLAGTYMVRPKRRSPHLSVISENLV